MGAAVDAQTTGNRREKGTTMRKYMVEFFDGIGPYSGLPEAPSADNTFDTLTQCRDYFAAVADTCHPYTATDDGGPWASVRYVSEWDGISYGDSRFAHLTIGPKGGIRTEWSW